MYCSCIEELNDYLSIFLKSKTHELLPGAIRLPKSNSQLNYIPSKQTQKPLQTNLTKKKFHTKQMTIYSGPLPNGR